MLKTSQVGIGLPKYVQLSELIIRDILSGRYIDGERLPPEKSMAKNFNVSVGTLRKALKILSRKKMLKQLQGSGNYVSSRTDFTSIYSMFRLELHEGGGLPTARVFDLKNMRKPTKLPKFGISTEGTRIRRIRYLNEITIALEEIWLDSSIGLLYFEDLNDSIYRLCRKKLGVWISRVEDRVSVSEVPNWVPKNFSIPAREMTGYVERFGWASDKEAIEYSRTWFDCKRVHYVQRMR